MDSIFNDLGFRNPEPEAQKAPKKRTIKQIARVILNSQDYIDSVERRVRADTLSSAVECRLYDYAYGKPVDKVEIKDTSDAVTEMSSEQLEAKAMALATLAKKLRSETLDGEVNLQVNSTIQ